MKLSDAQWRVLKSVADGGRMQTATNTVDSLRKRELIKANWCGTPYAGWWECAVTVKGREALEQKGK